MFNGGLVTGGGCLIGCWKLLFFFLNIVWGNCQAWEMQCKLSWQGSALTLCFRHQLLAFSAFLSAYEVLFFFFFLVHQTTTIVITGVNLLSTEITVNFMGDA